MRILVACESSGRVRDSFRLFGHDAWSCDVVPSQAGGPHILAPAEDVLSDGWDMLIAFPPCTYLSRINQVGRRAHPDRVRSALEFADKIRSSSVDKICVENPIGLLWQEWGRPQSVVEPWMFGDPYTKRTGLWLKNLPPLKAELVVQGAASWTNHVHSSDARSRTFWGLALAMASQWGGYVPPTAADVTNPQWPAYMWIGKPDEVVRA